MRLLLLLLIVFLFGCGKVENANHYSGLAGQYLSEGKFEESYNAITKALEIKPQVPEFLVGKGMAAIKINKLKIAKESYTKALDIYKKQQNIANSAFQSVYVLCLLGKTEEALKLFNESSKKFPDSQFSNIKFNDLNNGINQYRVPRTESGGRRLTH